MNPINSINNYSDLAPFTDSIVEFEWPSYFNKENTIAFGLIDDRPSRKNKGLSDCYNNTAVYFSEKDCLEGFKMRFATYDEISKVASDLKGRFKLYDENLDCHQIPCNWDDIKAQYKKRFAPETTFIFGSKDKNSLISMLPKELIKEILSKSIFILPPKSK